MASPSVTYTFTNGTTADATQVNQNFSDILNGISDGTKDLSINALTLAGTLNANGNINLGNASGDDLSIAASLASNLVPKTDATYTLGSSTIGFLGLYLGRNSRRVRLLASAALAASYDLTLPTSAGTDKYFLKTNGSGATSWGQLDDPAMMTTGAEVAQTTPGIVKQAGQLKATNTNDTAGLGYVGELLSRTKTRSSPQSLTSGNASNVTASAFALDPGDWLITASSALRRQPRPTSRFSPGGSAQHLGHCHPLIPWPCLRPARCACSIVRQPRCLLAM